MTRTMALSNAPPLSYKMECHRRQRNPPTYAHNNSPRRCCKFSCQFVMPCAAIHIGVTPKRHIRGTISAPTISPPVGPIQHYSIEAVNNQNTQSPRQNSREASGGTVSPVSVVSELRQLEPRYLAQNNIVSPVHVEPETPVFDGPSTDEDNYPAIRPRAMDKALPHPPVPRTPLPSIASDYRSSAYTVNTLNTLDEFYTDDTPLPEMPEIHIEASRSGMLQPPMSRDDIDSTLLAEAMAGFGGVDIATEMYDSPIDTPSLRRSCSTAFEYSRLPEQVDDATQQQRYQQQHVAPTTATTDSSSPDDVLPVGGMMDLSVLGGPGSFNDEDIGRDPPWAESMVRQQRLREHQESIKLRRDALNRADELEKKWRNSRTSY